MFTGNLTPDLTLSNTKTDPTIWLTVLLREWPKSFDMIEHTLKPYPYCTGLILAVRTHHIS